MQRAGKNQLKLVLDVWRARVTMLHCLNVTTGVMKDEEVEIGY